MSLFSDHDNRITACVSPVRPLYSTTNEQEQSRQNIQGIPMLLEYVEHLLIMGIDQIVFGVELSW